MIARRRVALFGLSVLLGFTALTPWASSAAPIAPEADFQAPMSISDANAIVMQAQQDTLETSTRTALEMRTVYFSETGHHLSNRTGFLDFWRANGQVLIFGYPVTEEIMEGNRVVQYFERARFEYYPEYAGTPQQVQLGLLGTEAAQKYGVPTLPVADPLDGTVFMPETGHTVLYDFYRYWQKRGDIAVFGYPISEPFEEGNGRIVQFFERQKMEYQPEDMTWFYRQYESYNGINLSTLYEVGLAQLGRDAALAAGHNTAPVEALAGVPQWEPTLWVRSIEVNLSTQWLTAYEDGLAVYEAPIATGRDGWNTPSGDFAIYSRTTMQDMQGNTRGESWYVPNIPWVQYVYGGVAIHGTYWHDLFGSGARPSHGCINVGMDDARWLYEWADIGVPVHIHY